MTTLITMVWVCGCIALAGAGAIELFTLWSFMGVLIYSIRGGRDSALNKQAPKSKVVYRDRPPKLPPTLTRPLLERHGLSDLDLSEDDVTILQGYTQRDQELRRLRMELADKDAANRKLHTQNIRLQRFADQVFTATSGALTGETSNERQVQSQKRGRTKGKKKTSSTQSYEQER
jgi:hypothetical protein